MKCEKCGYESEDNKLFQDIFLCSVCRQFAPPSDLGAYLAEKIDGRVLDPFRKFSKANISGMTNKCLVILTYIRISLQIPKDHPVLSTGTIPKV